jgi:two-component system, chemotaxis family, chemotaxis protein CheY
MSKRVLAVGNCGFDHGALAQWLQREFAAETVAAATADEALRAARSEPLALVLVNRVFDADGDSGLALIEKLKADPDTRALPVMLITNYPDHQATAVAAGAEPGFGKSALRDPATRERVARFLQNE